MNDKSEGTSHSDASDGGDVAIRAEYDWETTRPSIAVVETVASVIDRAAITLGPLYESVDPEALDALVGPSGPPTRTDTVTVSFVFAEHRVTVHGTGEIIVHKADHIR